MKKLKSINPATEEILGEVEVTGASQIKNKILRARQAYVGWKMLGLAKRNSYMFDLVERLRKKKEVLATMVSKEMGMPIIDSRADVEDAINYLNWYIENSEKYLSPEVLSEDGGISHKIYHEPVGVVAAITPWNYPVSNLVWSVGQNLIAGNVVVYKTSEEVPLTGLILDEIVRGSLPDGVFQQIWGDGETGKMLVNESIDMICFTGSSSVGKYLYKVAAKKFIKVILELGGSAPGIVFADANLESTVENIFFNRFGNCGQTCDGLKRLIIEENVVDDLLKLLSEKISKMRIGDPLDESVQLGPLVSTKQLSSLNDQVNDAKNKGALLVPLKIMVPEKGYYYPPTILKNIKKEMKVWQEEVFGPVLPIVTFKNEAEAIGLANDTVYGLGSYVYTKDKERAFRIASKLETGMVSINSQSYVKPHNPFGGYKLSGMGREHGKFGFHEVTQIKIVTSD